MKPPQIAKTLNVADSMAQAVELSGFSKSILKWAKSKGCPAFRGSRVYIDDLAPWIEQNKPDVGGDTLPTKDEVDVLLKLEKLEEQKFKNAKNVERYILRSDFEAWAASKAEQVKSTLNLKLKNELPPKLVGLAADEIASKMEPVVLDVCKIIKSPLK